MTYSTSARLVRYGQKKGGSGSSKKSVRLKLFFGSLSIILRRDDNVDSSSEPYDMILARCQGFELDVGQKDGGDRWLNASLNKVFVFDLGFGGRLSRLSLYRRVDHNVGDSFSVIVQGYSPPERSRELETGAEFDSQIILKIENDASSRVTKFTVIMSCLSSTASLGALKELTQFFGCKWPASDLSSTHQAATESADFDGLPETGPQASGSTKKAAHEYQMRFVLHYPRLVFVADEYDRQSRALVLRGYVHSSLLVWVPN